MPLPTFGDSNSLLPLVRRRAPSPKQNIAKKGSSGSNNESIKTTKRGASSSNARKEPKTDSFDKKITCPQRNHVSKHNGNSISDDVSDTKMLSTVTSNRLASDEHGPKASAVTTSSPSTPSESALLVSDNRIPINSLSCDLQNWLRNADQLIKSKEMKVFLSSSRRLVFSVGNVALHASCLPLAIPLHLTSESVEFFMEKSILVQRKANDILRSKEMKQYVSNGHKIAVSTGNVAFHVVCLPVAIPLHLVCESLDFAAGKRSQIQSKAKEIIQSKEIEQIVSSTRDVALSAGKVTFHLVCLPVAIPLHLGCESWDLATGVYSNIERKIRQPGTGESTSSDEGLIQQVGRVVPFICQAAGKVQQEVASSLMDNFISPLLSGLGHQHENDKVKSTVSPTGEVNNHDTAVDQTSACGIGQEIRDRVETNNRKSSSAAGQSSSEQDDDHFLDRLRLDYDLHYDKNDECRQGKKKHSVNHHYAMGKTSMDTANKGIYPNSNIGKSVASIPSPADTTKYLIYVADVEVMTGDESPVSDKEAHGRTFYYSYVDLGSEFSDQVLIQRSLHSMYIHGLRLIQNIPLVEVILPQQAISSPLTDVSWKPEGSTAKLLKRQVKMKSSEWIELLKTETLIWSGKFTSSIKNIQQYQPYYKLKEHDVYRRKFGLYTARGIVKGSPKDFLNLLWDDTRTSEYNNFCMGRSTLIVVGDSDNDDILKASADSQNLMGTKVVKSETRVPFTSLSVVLTTMMHVRTLPAPQQPSSEGVQSNGCESGVGVGGYIIISRSLDSGKAGSHCNITCGGKSQLERQTVDGNSQNSILWGINVLRPVQGHPDLTDLTSLSQVGSSLVPQFLSHRIGIMAIEDFFRNVRHK